MEDGARSAGMWVVLAGSMELLHEGEVIQALGPGECFGHPSLLSGMAPAFTVRTREPATCGLLGSADARRLLGTEAEAVYVARTMRVRLTRTGHTVHGLLDVGTTPVSAIMRPAAFCAADLPAREAARRLDDEDTSALLVRLADGELGIVTDAEVRAAVAAGGGTLDAPVGVIARAPAPTVPVGQLAIEATVDMLAAGVEHLVVLDGTRPCGVLGAADLLGLDARSPIALRHTILGAANAEVLARATSHQPRLFLMLVRAGVPPRDLGRVLSLQHDAVVTRLVDFSSAHGPAPVPWAWLDVGSAARREFTLASDQDNALAYGTPAAGHEQQVDDYFARLGADVNDGLARCGIGVDDNGVLALNWLWRMSRSDWLRTFDECSPAPHESHLIRASVAFDFRTAGGGLAITAALNERMRAARQHPDFMHLLAANRGGLPGGPRLPRAAGGGARRRGRRAPGPQAPGDRPARQPRALSRPLARRDLSPTIDRIEAVASVGGLDRAQADALLEAYAVITRLRFQHHAALIADGAPLENLLDPGELTPIARGELREALHVVRRAQRQLGPYARGVGADGGGCAGRAPPAPRLSG